MNNIEEMRKDFERKLKNAEIENQIETAVGVRCHYMGESCTQKGHEWLNFGTISKEDAVKVLKAFPNTEKILTSHPRKQEKISLTWLLQLHRYPNGADELEIEWISEGRHISLHTPISLNDETIGQYLKRDSYEINDSTIGLYFGAVSPRQKASLKYVSCLNFNCGEVIRYQGGYFKQISEGHSSCIISELIDS